MLALNGSAHDSFSQWKPRELHRSLQFTASILVDAGLSCRETLKRMKIAGEDPDKLKAS